MCGKYILSVGNDREITNNTMKVCENGRDESDGISAYKEGIINPGDDATVLIVANWRVCARTMKWGFTKEGGLLINARSEDVHDRVTFMALVDSQRCAMPATGYFEWRDRDHLRHMISRRESGYMYLAGLYRIDADGKERFVVMTRRAYGEHAKIHGRMPCILFTREDSRKWLRGELAPESFSEMEYAELEIIPQEPEQLSMDFYDSSEVIRESV